MLECQMCNSQVPKVPKLICSHFLCPECYVNEKTVNRHACCPVCFKKLRRRSS